MSSYSLVKKFPAQQDLLANYKSWQGTGTYLSFSSSPSAFSTAVQAQTGTSKDFFLKNEQAD